MILRMTDEPLVPIVWTEEFELGIPEIDEDHRGLVTLYNDMVCALRRSVSATMTRDIVASLCRFMRLHMRREEALMPPGYDTEVHLRQHRACEAVLVNLEGGDAAGQPLAGIAGFLRGWILGHVLVHDRALFTRGKAAASCAAGGKTASPEPDRWPMLSDSVSINCPDRACCHPPGSPS